LSSAARLAAARGGSLRPGCAEVLLGTTHSVFFYASPFRYPNTSCGLLFAVSLDTHHGNDGVAPPFDSGGLIKICVRHDPAEPPRESLSRHEMPIPEHRRYLALSMEILFHDPKDYIDGAEPRWPGPIGLTGGDQRRWTHEVRIRDPVFVRGSNLQAVFAARARVAAEPEIERLFQWREGESVDRIQFDTSAGSDFDALQRRCLDYIRGSYTRFLPMESPWNVEDLEIVGYADVFKETMLPTVAPPVFRLKADPQRALLPPYFLNAGFLCNATEAPQSELEDLRDGREITLFDHAFPALRDFELWVDQSFQIHYEPLDVARKNLGRIADAAIENAEKALLNGDLQQAERLSGVAISADSRRVEPLAIKAAIRRMQHNQAGERLMAELAAHV
jgi:hypothetical protein